jgi:hypothetical protein
MRFASIAREFGSKRGKKASILMFYQLARFLDDKLRELGFK